MPGTRATWDGCPGADKLTFTREKPQGFGSLVDVEWKCPTSTSPFLYFSAQINSTPRLDFLSYEDGFNIDLFCIVLHQLLLATGWKPSGKIANDKWFDKI